MANNAWAGVIADGGWEPTRTGVPQGGVASPLWSNIFLTPFDHAMTAAGYRVTRWADNFVVVCRTRQGAQSARALAGSFLRNELGVSLHPEKTRIVHVDHGFEFLGYKVKRGKGLRLSAAKYPRGDGRLAIGGMRMPDAGLELELAIAQDLCRMRLRSCWGVWSGVDVSVSNRSSRWFQKRWHQERTFRQLRGGTDCCRPRFISGAVWPSLALSVCRVPRSCRRSWRSKSPRMFDPCQRRFWKTSRPQPMTRHVAGGARKRG